MTFAIAYAGMGDSPILGEDGDTLECEGGNAWTLVRGEREGWDTVRENLVVAAAPDIPTAAAAPAVPRDAAGTPLEVDLGPWVPGDVLRVEWYGSAAGVLSPGASGILVPRVLVEGQPDGYLDNGAQFGLVGVPGTLVYAFGGCVVPLSTSARVRVQLGLILVQGAPGDQLSLFGGPMNLAGPPVFTSTWLRAARVARKRFVSLPPVTVRALPVPS